MNNTQTYRLNPISNKTHDKLFNEGGETYQLFEPGMCFLSPWVFSPLYATDQEYLKEYSKRYHQKILSFDYWLHWRKRRAPIAVVLPNKSEWCLDERIGEIDRDVFGTFPFVTVDKPLITSTMKAEISNGILSIVNFETKPSFIESLRMF